MSNTRTQIDGTDAKHGLTHAEMRRCCATVVLAMARALTLAKQASAATPAPKSGQGLHQETLRLNRRLKRD